MSVEFVVVYQKYQMPVNVASRPYNYSGQTSERNRIFPLIKDGSDDSVSTNTLQNENAADFNVQSVGAAAAPTSQEAGTQAAIPPELDDTQAADPKSCKNELFPIRSGALCYPRCRKGYRTSGPICWQITPPGHKDIGVVYYVDHGPIIPPSSVLGCAPDEDYDAGLCYKKPQPGWKRIATFAYKNCPAGWRDDGLYCAKPGTYGRGVGGKKAGCEKKYGAGNCETNGGLWYQKCKEGFTNAGCCICNAVCPADFKDIGVSCKKPSVTSNGKAIHACSSGKEKIGLLCYEPCRTGWVRTGLTCHESCSPGKWNGTGCQKASYGNGAGKPLAGTGTVFIILAIAAAVIGVIVIKNLAK